MTNTQIRYFLEVAQDESFTKAAAKLFISHQALSNHIKALEKELELRLLDRSNKRKVVLTEAGKVMFDAWVEMLAIENHALERAKKVQEAETRKLIIGIQDMKFVRSYVIPMIQKAQSGDMPYSVEYRLGYPEELLDMLEDGRVDMLVMISSDVKRAKRYHTRSIPDSELHPAIVMSKQHSLAKKKTIKIQDLNQETVLMVDTSYSNEATRRFKQDMKHFGFMPASIKTFHGPREITIAVETGGGVAVIFEELLEESKDNIRIVPIELSPEQATVRMLLVWKKDELTEAAKKMASL